MTMLYTADECVDPTLVYLESSIDQELSSGRARVDKRSLQ